MNLSNLHPAEGSKHSDSFRRGRGHASGNGKTDRKSTRLNSSHMSESRMPSSA